MFNVLTFFAVANTPHARSVFNVQAKCVLISSGSGLNESYVNISEEGKTVSVNYNTFILSIAKNFTQY